MNWVSLKNRVEECVKDLEKKSEVEFVSVFAKESHSYLFFKLLVSVFVSLVTALAFAGVPWASERSLFISLAAGIALLLTWGLLEIPGLFRMLAPSSMLKAEVEEAAQLAFLRERVFETKERTGILIYVSQLEQAVFVMADCGLLKIIPHQEWREIGAKMAQAFQRLNEEDLFLLALTECSQKLEPHFPYQAENRNQLTDQLRRS